jgi:hypothetical protein
MLLLRIFWAHLPRVVWAIGPLLFSTFYDVTDCGKVEPGPLLAGADTKVLDKNGNALGWQDMMRVIQSNRMKMVGAVTRLLQYDSGLDIVETNMDYNNDTMVKELPVSSGGHWGSYWASHDLPTAQQIIDDEDKVRVGTTCQVFTDSAGQIFTDREEDRKTAKAAGGYKGKSLRTWNLEPQSWISFTNAMSLRRRLSPPSTLNQGFSIGSLKVVPGPTRLVLSSRHATSQGPVNQM